jgi:predicted oxidoreductase
MSTLNINGAPRCLGQTSLAAFPIAYGCWRFAGTDVKTARAKVEAALEYGVTLFDHADVYGCDGGGSFGDAETLFGQVLADAPQLRAQMTLATKGGIDLGVPYDSSATYLRSAVEASLRRLQIDVIDLYQIHRPDFLGHPEEIAGVLTALRDEGKIREVGVSNYTPSQFSALQAWLPFPIATHQPEFSCWSHGALRDGVLDQCLETRVTPLAWSPLAGGRLGLSLEEAAQTSDGPRLVGLLEELDALAASQEVSRAAIALAWVLAHPAGIIPIIGTQRVSRIKESVAAVNVQLTRADWNRILVAAQGEPLP